MRTKTKGISEEELNRAVNKFIKEGGIIKKLPDQKAVAQNRVGGKWATTEWSTDITTI